MKKFNFEPLKELAVKAGKCIGSGIVMALPYIVSGMVNAKHDSASIGYFDAVDVIVNSYMPSSCQQEAIAVLKRYETEDYYKSVISVVNSYMSSSNQVETIRKLSGEE